MGWLSIGFVKVTVVGWGPQWSQTVTVVVQPGRIPVLEVASGQTVVVMVVTIVVKPAGQIST